MGCGCNNSWLIILLIILFCGDCGNGCGCANTANNGCGCGC